MSMGSNSAVAINTNGGLSGSLGFCGDSWMSCWYDGSSGIAVNGLV